MANERTTRAQKGRMALDSPIFVVKFQKGLADRHRLPIDHVIRALEEIRQMISEVGKQIERSRGIESPSGDYGLELLADERGFAFKGGSLQAAIAITHNVQTGIQAAERVLGSVNLLNKKKGPKATREVSPDIVRRLNRIAIIQQTDRTEMQLTVQKPGRKKPEVAVFGETAIASARALQAPTFAIEGVTIFGKLSELRDKDPTEDSSKGLLGELRRENGEVWRVEFKSADISKAIPLLTKQVSVTGRALYYRVSSPKLVAESIQPDAERDYEDAFDELYGCDRDNFKTNLQTLLREMRDE